MQSIVSSPLIAATIVGAPNIVPIPADTPINKPQETFPVKKPIPTEIIAKAAKALPPEPVATVRALQIVTTKAFPSVVPIAFETPDPDEYPIGTTISSHEQPSAAMVSHVVSSAAMLQLRPPGLVLRTTQLPPVAHLHLDLSIEFSSAQVIDQIYLSNRASCQRIRHRRCWYIRKEVTIEWAIFCITS